MLGQTRSLGGGCPSPPASHRFIISGRLSIDTGVLPLLHSPPRKPSSRKGKALRKGSGADRGATMAFFYGSVCIGLAVALVVRFSFARRRTAFAFALAAGEPECAARQCDPYCGTLLSVRSSHRLEHAGEVFHFCSTECRDRFLTLQQAAPRC